MACLANDAAPSGATGNQILRSPLTCVFIRSDGVGRRKRNATLRSETEIFRINPSSVVRSNEDTANLAATIRQFEWSARLRRVRMKPCFSLPDSEHGASTSVELEWRSIEFAQPDSCSSFRQEPTGSRANASVKS